MKRLLTLLTLMLAVAGGTVTHAGNGLPSTAGLSHRYGIFYFSGDGADMDQRYGSFLSFQLKAGVGATYDYFINDEQHVEGHVGQYLELEGERQYVLEAFFDGRDHARLRIMDMPTCDNMKVAVIQYEDQQRDTTGVLLQYILTDGAFRP